MKNKMNGKNAGAVTAPIAPTSVNQRVHAGTVTVPSTNASSARPIRTAQVDRTKKPASLTTYVTVGATVKPLPP
jgi:hypothetical protein